MQKRKVNRNFIWAKAFVNQLYAGGVRNVCISPGSRSTPLTLAFANEKRIKCYINIDERSSAFFALGIAKVTNKPVVVVTTSGTATAELYPAIIEAYQSRIPLIICTADRPPELLNSGANQTINQRNIYRNHIRWFKNVGLPELTTKKLERLQHTTLKAIEISTKKNAGPVHLNFPFRKPLEPNSFTDEIDSDLLKSFVEQIIVPVDDKNAAKIRKHYEKKTDKIAEQIINSTNGLIIAGPKDYDKVFRKDVKTLSIISGYPILADGVSHLRFKTKKSDKYIISNYDAFLRSDIFRKKNKPEIILQFGRTVTSQVLENYLAESNAARYLINDFGDWYDPSKKSRTPIRIEPPLFIERVIKRLNELTFKRKSKTWFSNFKTANELTSRIKTSLISKVTFSNEARIISEINSVLPSNTQLFIGNSLPIRDFDYFTGNTAKDFKIYFNRGASGIDGVTSTALGIASNKKPTVLITGDLSFLHDLNSLIIAKHNNLPLTVILINNNGGGIFSLLPVSNYKKQFNRYFTTPHNLEIPAIVKSFGLSYNKIKNWSDLQKKLLNSVKEKSFSVLEIKTDPQSSIRTRLQFWNEVIKIIDKKFK